MFINLKVQISPNVTSSNIISTTLEFNNILSYSLPFRRTLSNLVRVMYRLASTKVSDQFMHAFNFCYTNTYIRNIHVHTHTQDEINNNNDNNIYVSYNKFT